MWVLGASARPPSRFSNIRNVDPRQRQAQQARIEKQRQEWKSWEDSMEKNEEIYRAQRGVRPREGDRPSRRLLPEANRDGSSMQKRADKSSNRMRTPLQSKQRDNLDLMGNLYTRQRLYQKVNGFSQLIGEIQQAREQQSEEPEQARGDNKEVMESFVIDQTSTRVHEEDTWDW